MPAPVHVRGLGLPHEGGTVLGCAIERYSVAEDHTAEECGKPATAVVDSSLASAGVGDSLTTTDGDGSHVGATGDTWMRLIRDSKAGANWSPETRSGDSPGARAGGSSIAGGGLPPRTGDSRPPGSENSGSPRSVG